MQQKFSFMINDCILLVAILIENFFPDIYSSRSVHLHVKNLNKMHFKFVRMYGHLISCTTRCSILTPGAHFSITKCYIRQTLGSH